MGLPRQLTYQGTWRALWGAEAEGTRRADIRAGNPEGTLPNDIAICQMAPGKERVDDHRMLTVDEADNATYNGTVQRPVLQPIKCSLLSNGTQHFFIAPYRMRIRKIQQIHATAETTAATLTGYIEKTPNGVAPGGGTSVMSNTFDLKATANTLQTATFARQDYIELAENDRLSFVQSAAATELAGGLILVWVEPGGRNTISVLHKSANGALVDEQVFLANRPGIVTVVKYVHGTAGTNGSAVNVQLVKDTSTDAPGAGTDILTNNTNAGFDCKGTINTVQEGTLTATAATKRFLTGNRISVDFAGTLTALANVLVVVVSTGYDFTIDVSYQVQANGSLADAAFFIADRNYRVIAARAVWGTASSGATNVQLVADKATDAPGAGVDLLTNDSNAGFQTDGTANTPEIGVLVDPGLLYIMEGDRLSVDFSGTLTALAGLCITVTLEAL